MADMKHWRTGGGAAHKQKKDEPVVLLPFKDVGASVPGLDISAGLMQENDSPKSLQLGEATEELGYIDAESLFKQTVRQQFILLILLKEPQ